MEEVRIFAIVQSLWYSSGSSRDLSTMNDCVTSTWIVSNTIFDLINLIWNILLIAEFEEIWHCHKMYLLWDTTLPYLEYQMASIVTNWRYFNGPGSGDRFLVNQEIRKDKCHCQFLDFLFAVVFIVTIHMKSCNISGIDNKEIEIVLSAQIWTAKNKLPSYQLKFDISPPSPSPMLCPSNFKNLCFCSSIRNCIAYANEANIKKKRFS